MIFCLHTGTPTCHMSLLDGNKTVATKEWLAERRLATELLSQIEAFLEENQASFSKLSGFIVFRGLGSFTGLRIGVTVVNAMSYALHIPIVGEIGQDWMKRGAKRLLKGDNDKIVMPEYGQPPHITQPRK